MITNDVCIGQGMWNPDACSKSSCSKVREGVNFKERLSHIDD